MTASPLPHRYPATLRHRLLRALALGASLVAAACAQVPMPSSAGSTALPAVASTRLTYPAAPPGGVTDERFGQAVADPYRSLEQIDAPATRAWVDAQSRLTQQVLAGFPGRTRLRERLTTLLDYQRLGVPFQADGHVFLTRNSGLQNQSPLYEMVGALMPDGAAHAKLVFDPNLLSADGHLVVTGYVASRDGHRIAYGVSEGGSDWTDWHVRDLDLGRDLPDVLRHTKYYPPVVNRSGDGLYYSAFPAPAPGTELSAPDLGNALFFHPLGSAPGTDRPIPLPVGAPDWQYEPNLSSDGRWLVIRAGQGEVGDRGVENIYLLDLQRPQNGLQALAEGFSDAWQFIDADRGLLFFATNREAPRGRVVATDALHPDLIHARTIVAEQPDALDFTTRSVSLVAHQLVARSLHDAHSRVQRWSIAGALLGELTLPGPGTAEGFSGSPVDAGTCYTYQDAITPATVSCLSLPGGQVSVLEAPTLPFDAQALVTEQVFYPGRDGTPIPLLLAHRRDLKRDGNAPVLLYGYGGFAIPVLPAFNAARMAWLELGGVLAVANIRGGGEYGEAWHQAGIRARKQTGFDDFMAAGDWLVAQHYTRPARLAIEGGSNGGLLIGACVTQRPDLFGAAVAQVGVLDMLRFPLYGQGAGWEGDYGNPAVAEDFNVLRAYSPVHNVHAGTRYPATLIVTGDHDTRVMPMHSFKFAAALQAAQSGAAPVLLYVEQASGHGGGANVSQMIDQQADQFAFLAAALGVALP